MTKQTKSKVMRFPSDGKEKKISSTERIWGSAVMSLGYVGVPSILLQGQQRLGLNALQMNIVLQLLEYWREPSRRPFPSKKNLADRIGVTQKTIQTNIRSLESADLVRREQQKTAAGDWGSNIYHLDGLVQRVQKMEPEFSKTREARRSAGEIAQTPMGKRKA